VKDLTILDDNDRDSWCLKTDKIYAWLFFTAFLLLGTVIGILIYRLTVKDRYMKKENP
jgi:hypothetical protein